MLVVMCVARGCMVFFTDDTTAFFRS